MFIIVYIIITAAACGMVYLGYLQGTERFYMTLFSAAVVLYCIYLDFKKRREKKAEDQKTERYKELSPHDMFLWRISDPGNPRVISRRALTKEQEEKEAEVNRQFEQLLQEKFGDSGG